MASMERELSVLFADVSGSTKLYEKLGDTEALHAVDRCIKRMERSVEGFRGRIVKVVGDELMAVFTSAEDAFHAASDMQQRVGDLPPVSGVKLAVRLGFHHGPVVEADDGIVGDTVAIAARLAGLARADQVLTSGETVARLPELLQLSTRALEPGSAKERIGGVQLFEILWQGGEVSATPVPRSPARPAALPKLRLQHAGKTFVLDAQRPGLSLGRDAACDVRVRDRRASRQHAQIERRGSDYVLSDLSTNGTYVTIAGEAEVFLRRSDLILRGTGRISFAAPAASDGADIAEFEFLV